MKNKWYAFNRLNGSWGLAGQNFNPTQEQATKAETILNSGNLVVDLLERIYKANDLHAVFTIKDSPEYKALAALMLGSDWEYKQQKFEFQQQKCKDGQLPDGPVCPSCGGERAPSGIDGGSWVHYTKKV